ncbi:hypothetical protein MY3296_004129 [Beauveria thailandica]
MSHPCELPKLFEFRNATSRFSRLKISIIISEAQDTDLSAMISPHHRGLNDADGAKRKCSRNTTLAQIGPHLTAVAQLQNRE